MPVDELINILLRSGLLADVGIWLYAKILDDPPEDNARQLALLLHRILGEKQNVPKLKTEYEYKLKPWHRTMRVKRRITPKECDIDFSNL